MTDLLRDAAAFALQPVSSLAAWLVVTAVLCAIAAGLTTVGERLTTPISVELALHPVRVAAWMPLSLIAIPLTMAALALTIVGAGLAVIILLALPLLVTVGYCALAELIGADLLARRGRSAAPPQLAAVTGVVLIRLLKLVPVVGPVAHSLVVWIALGAVCVVLRDVAASAYHRRLPDEVQFEGDGVVEWTDDSN